MSTRNFASSFAFHGVNLEVNNEGNLVADCPFCGSEYHFSVKAETGQWRCFKCEDLGNRGNLYTFLRRIWEKCRASTSTDLLQHLSYSRGISVKTLTRNGVCKSPYLNKWLIPVWKLDTSSGNPSLVNLKVWGKWDDGKKPFIKGTPNCAQHLYGRLVPDDYDPRVLLAEGEWDALVLMEQFPERTVLGVPGSASFKPEWANYFSGKDVILLYDNDEAGRNGTRLATNTLYSSRVAPKRIRALVWPEGTPEKWDIRDQYKKDSEGLESFIMENLVEAIADDINVDRNSWDEVLDDFRNVYHVDRTFADVCTLVAASCVAARVPGDPLWMFLVGPPSTSKTAIVDAFSFDKEHCETISKITATQLVSGWKVPGSDEDVSIFPLLRSRTLLIQDYTTIIAMPAAQQEDLYGMLREAYGGRVRIRYGNGKIVDQEDVYFSMVAAVTDVIRRDNKADLGERFLKIEVLGDDYDPMAVTLAAMNGVVKDASRTRKLQILGESIKKFLSSIRVDYNNLPEVTDEYRTQIGNLSLVVGYLRAIVHKDGDDISVRPRAEGGPRVAKQLVKLAICLLLLQKKTRMDDEVMRLVRKAAVDTVWGFSMEVCQLIAKCQESGGLTTDEIAARLQVPKTSLRRIVDDLQKLGVLHRAKVGNGQGAGRDSNLWQFSPTFGSIWNLAGLTSSDRGKTPPAQIKKLKKKAILVENNE